MKPFFGFLVILPLLTTFAEVGYHYQVYLTPKANGEIEVEEIYRFSQESEITQGLFFLKLPKSFFQKSKIKKIALFENNLPLKPIALAEKSPYERAIYFEKLKGTNLKVVYVIDNMINFKKEKGTIKVYLKPFAKEEILSFKIYVLLDSITFWQSQCASGPVKNFKKKAGMAFQIIDVQDEIDTCTIEIEFAIPESWQKKITQKDPFLIEYKLIALWLLLSFSIALLWPMRFEKVFIFLFSFSSFVILFWESVTTIWYQAKIFFWQTSLAYGLSFALTLFLAGLFLSLIVIFGFFYLEPNRRHDFSTYLWAFALPCLVFSSLFFLETKDGGMYRLLLSLSSLIFLLRPKIKNYFLFLENDLETLIHSLPLKATALAEKFSLPKDIVLNKIKILWGYPFAIDHKNKKIVALSKKDLSCFYCGAVAKSKKKQTCDFCGSKIALTKTSPLPSFVFALKHWAQTISWAFALSSLITGIFFVSFLLFAETKSLALWLISVVFPIMTLFFYHLSRSWPLQIEKGLGYELSIFLLLTQVIFLYPLLILYYLSKKGNKFYFGFFKNSLFPKKNLSLKELSHFWRISPWDSHILAIYLSQKGIFSYDYFLAKAYVKNPKINWETVKYKQ